LDGEHDEAPVVTRTISYKRVGPHEIRADVYCPDVHMTARRPVVLWLHGGGLIFGSRADLATVWRDQLQRYLTNGFVVFAPDYRLAPETKLDAIVEDVQDAYLWLRENGSELFGIDPDRVAVVGHSAGGYLALTAGWLCRPRPAVLLSLYGYGDITGSWYTRPSPHSAVLLPLLSTARRLAIGSHWSRSAQRTCVV